MSKIEPKIESSWKAVLAEEFASDYFESLKEFLVQEKSEQVVYPPGSKIFSAFELTPFDKVKVVILGQDPYHGPGQAHGLSFSVPEGVRPPPSLKNIFKELNRDLALPIPETGNLESWAQQGVLLLNATLTVRASQPGSHQKRGWEQFTDSVITKLSTERSGLVFMLWGRFAKDKASLIDASKHHILQSTHPSPFSAHHGFLGCGHFSTANQLLEKQDLTPINWQLT